MATGSTTLRHAFDVTNFMRNEKASLFNIIIIYIINVIIIFQWGKEDGEWLNGTVFSLDSVTEIAESSCNTRKVIVCGENDKYHAYTAIETFC